jgi:hypothetical protein
MEILIFNPIVQTYYQIWRNFMATNAANLISMVDSLPTDVKTELLEKLLNSLKPTQKEIDKLWAK